MGGTRVPILKSEKEGRDMSSLSAMGGKKKESKSKKGNPRAQHNGLGLNI